MCGDLAHNPGMCPDWEWNQRPFGSQASTQSTESHQPGLKDNYEINIIEMIQWGHVPYFGMYNVHFCAQIFEEKIEMCIIHG